MGKKEVLAYSNKRYASADELMERAILLQRMSSTLKGMEFSGAISYLLKELKLRIVDITDLEEDSESLSYRCFLRYKNSEIKNLSKRKVIAICISMRLPLVISLLMLEIAGFVLTNSLEDAFLYLILDSHVGLTFDMINKMLEQNGFEPLTNKNS